MRHTLQIQVGLYLGGGLLICWCGRGHGQLPSQEWDVFKQLMDNNAAHFAESGAVGKPMRACAQPVHTTLRPTELHV